MLWKGRVVQGQCFGRPAQLASNRRSLQPAVAGTVQCCKGWRQLLVCTEAMHHLCMSQKASANLKGIPRLSPPPGAPVLHIRVRRRAWDEAWVGHAGHRQHEEREGNEHAADGHQRPADVLAHPGQHPYAEDDCMVWWVVGRGG